MAPKHETKPVYVVFEGRINRPTILSSWAQVHPLVAGWSGAKHETFKDVEAAREELKSRGLQSDENIKDAVAPSVKSVPGKYYAVAYGKKIGIFNEWRHAEVATKGTDACYERFKTMEAAVQFIEDWKTSYAEASLWEITKALNEGLRPKSMQFKAGFFLKKDWNWPGAENELPNIGGLELNTE
ncbi:hypothetical protein LOZ58_004154 [Ophidiomyces ophidiicola]|nr:hypothetical protein LOZ58_004154 [Ophidiomyces ophidiicola]